MKKFLLTILSGAIICTAASTSFAAVSTGHMQNDSQAYTLTYPIVEVDDKKVANKINDDILAQANDLKTQVENKALGKADMTYYKKYEDKNIVSLLFYVTTRKRFSGNADLKGYTITYDKHTGQRVPMSKYLNINLAQLQDALNHSKAYAIDGLDNGVNLDRQIPYVSDNYFICSDGSIGLLYQPGDLMPEDAGSGKIIVSLETINKANAENLAKSTAK